MGVWGWILVFVVGVAAFILALSFLFNVIVYRAAGRHSEKTIRKCTRALEELLPGRNCGGCGCKTCAEYARAVFELQKDTNCCTEGPAELPQQLSAQMDTFFKQMENDTPKEKDGWLH